MSGHDATCNWDSSLDVMGNFQWISTALEVRVCRGAKSMDDYKTVQWVVLMLVGLRFQTLLYLVDTSIVHNPGEAPPSGQRESGVP